MSAEARVAPPATARLLLIDDDPHVRPAYTKLLIQAGFEAEGCGDPSVALARAMEGQFDGFLVDIMMRGAPLGHEIITDLRANPRTARLPILAMTGFGDEMLDKALRLGADAALCKTMFDVHFIPTVTKMLAESKAAARGAARVLIVEDDPQFNDLLEQTMSCEAGGPYITRSCASVSQAVTMLDKWRPHLVILDLTLAGGGNGMSILRDLDSRRLAGHFGVIVVSAARNPNLPPMCLDLGADDFLRKPFPSEELLARARAVLRRTRHIMGGAHDSLSAGPLRLDLERRTVVAGKISGPALTRSELSLLLLLFECHPGTVPWGDAELAVRGVAASGSGEASAPLRALLAGLRSKHPPEIAACFTTRRGAGIALDVTGFSTQS